MEYALSSRISGSHPERVLTAGTEFDSTEQRGICHSALSVPHARESRPHFLRRRTSFPVQLDLWLRNIQPGELAVSISHDLNSI